MSLLSLFRFATSKMGQWVIISLVVFAAVVVLRWDAVQDEKTRSELKRGRDTIELIERVQDEISGIRTADDARRVLEKRNNK